MFGIEITRKASKVLFHILQVIILLSGIAFGILGLILSIKTDALIPLPEIYIVPIVCMCILSVVNGYLGFVCLNSQNKTKTFLYIYSLCILLNLQIYLAIKADNIVDHGQKWTNNRWNAFTLPQRSFIQNQYGCCGLETINDRVAETCKFDVPCQPFFEKMLRTIRKIVQKMLIYMFFIETFSLSTFGFLKFIK